MTNNNSDHLKGYRKENEIPITTFSNLVTGKPPIFSEFDLLELEISIEVAKKIAEWVGEPSDKDGLKRTFASTNTDLGTYYFNVDLLLTNWERLEDLRLILDFDS